MRFTSAQSCWDESYAAAAYERGFYSDLVAPFRGLNRDNILRPDTTLEKLATLKPAFDKSSGKGTLTAGNSTNLSDGASAALLSSEEWAREHGKEVLAYLVDAQVAAVDFVHGEGLLMAPAWAVAQLLKRTTRKRTRRDIHQTSILRDAPHPCPMAHFRIVRLATHDEAKRLHLRTTAQPPAIEHAPR